MNVNAPVFTVLNECQDCYKCVRHCGCKAIRIEAGHATVIAERCVSCGECVKVCPAGAKKIRSDLPHVEVLLASGRRVYVSVAPSYVGYFPGLEFGRLVSALKQCGFTGASETAVGAQLVSARTAAILADAESGIFISSACPAAVDYISKYHSGWASKIVKVESPLLTHARMLKECFGHDAAVVFIGPCAAKKNESDRNPDVLDVVLTFPRIAAFMESRGINPYTCEPVEPVLETAQEGRMYSVEGGMNDTLRTPGDGVRYVAVSGLDNIGRMLGRTTPDAVDASGVKLFLEILVCDGGCVNGPAAVSSDAISDISSIVGTARLAALNCSVGRENQIVSMMTGFQAPMEFPVASDQDLRQALERVGKFSARDELNCGGCGYNSCRDFAQAMIEGHAEPAMCLSYLRKLSQRTSNALIKYIPAAVVFVGLDLKIIETNRRFAELCGSDATIIFDTRGSLSGLDLKSLFGYEDLFRSVLINGGDVRRYNQMYEKKILNISVFSVSEGQSVGAVVQDVTEVEMQREQIAERAREVIRKNVLTVQNVARCLGEHMAETEILLSEVADIYANPSDSEVEVHHDK